MYSNEELRMWKDSYIERLRACAEELFNKSMPKLTEEKFALTEKTGNRLIYEEVYFTRRKYLAVFGCLAICDEENRKRYIRRLEDILDDICEEECWALPAHVDRKSNPEWRIYVDLFASETAEAFAEILHYLKNELSAELCRKMKENVMHRVIRPYLSRRPYDKWEDSDMNWNAVCNGSIGIAALYLLDEDKELQSRIIFRVCADLEYFIGGYAEDGTCFEGLSYFTYGFYFYMAFMTLLSKKEEYIEFSFLDEKCRSIAEFQQKCYFHSGITMSFSDGYIHDRFRMGLTCKLMEIYDTVAMPPIEEAAEFDADTCYRFLMILRDIKWTEAFIEKNNDVFETESVEECIELPDAQWGICHSSYGGGMACKGGNNDEPHNHNDIGNFFFLLDKDMMLTDLGAGEYTKQYFSDGRYDILCNNSFGHNVPLIDGKGQKEGKEFACDEFCFDGKGKFEMSIGKAYGSNKLKSLERKLSYDGEKETLLIEDIFESDGCLIEENLVTQQDVTVSENGVLIRSDEHTCRITIENLANEIELKRERHLNHEGQQENVIRIVWKVADAKEKGRLSCKYKVEKV